MRRAALTLIFVLWPAVGWAGLSERELSQVVFNPPHEARVPMSLTFKDLDGRDVTLGEAIGGRPTVLLPADFTCANICGPALSIGANALRETNLTAGRDYSLVIVGINPHDTIGDARRFASAQVGGPGIAVLTGNAEAIGSLTKAIGYTFQIDPENNALAHPAAFATLTADGRVSHTLSSLALDASDLRLALIEAAEGKLGGIGGRFALLCYGFDPVHGIYARQITNLLRLAGGLTAALVASAIGLMLWRSRDREASG
jgi:protein SCO1